VWKPKETCRGEVTKWLFEFQRSPPDRVELNDHRQVQNVDAMTVADFDIFEIENLALLCGTHLECARLVFKTYGQLNAARDNAVLMPTYYAGQHADTELMMGPGALLILLHTSSSSRTC
jgi:hypothetical protein